MRMYHYDITGRLFYRIDAFIHKAIVGLPRGNKRFTPINMNVHCKND